MCSLGCTRPNGGPVGSESGASRVSARRLGLFPERAQGDGIISSTVLYAIPTDPRWVPDAVHEAAAVAVFTDVVNDVGDLRIHSEHEGLVRFYDAGENFETVRCPVCGTVIARNPEDMTWFLDQINRCWTEDTGFWPLDVVTPCCGTQTSLNDVIYQGAQGFASWSVSARDPRIWELTERQRTTLEAALGHRCRVVYAHY